MAGGISISVKEIDRGWKAIRGRIERLGDMGHVTRVGVQGAPAAANHQGTSLTVAQIANIHEFGKVIHQPRMKRVIVIPERSFIRRTVDLYQEAIARREVLLAQGVVLGKFELRQGLELFGMYVVVLIQQRMANGIDPPNKPSTIARKGSSKPLIDRGQLRQSITHIVEAAP